MKGKYKHAHRNYKVENVLQSPNVTLEDFLDGLNKAVERQFRERNDLSNN
jgi:hypothetical protein